MTLGRRFAIVAIFASLGPPAGSAALIIGGLGWNLITGDGPSEGMGAAGALVGGFLLFFFSLIIAYPAGIVPAALTGLVVACLAGRISDLRLWLALSTVVGGLCAVWLAGWPLSNTLTDPANDAFSVKALIGGVAGLLSAAAAWPVVSEQRARSAPATAAAGDDWSAG